MRSSSEINDSRQLERERQVLLEQINDGLDGFMLVLSLAWVALLVAELAQGGLPGSLQAVVWLIWAIFILDFVLEFTIAPRKLDYLRSHWITGASLVLPAVRLVRVVAAMRLLGATRVARSVGLLRILTSTNRGLASLRATAARRGLGYLITATILVLALGAAGMGYFESPASYLEAGIQGEPLANYSDALWWTAYAMSTGATSLPRTAEGRILGWLLSLYGLGVFGYLTAALASHFVGREREQGGGVAARPASAAATSDAAPEGTRAPNERGSDVG